MHTLYLFFITVPLTAVIVGLVYTIARNVGRLWLDHRVKLALLDKLESKPELLRSFDELQDLLDDTPKYDNEKNRIDFIAAGVTLALVGIGCVLVAQPIGGRTAVGVYVGGVASVALGFILALVGLLTWFLTKPPITRTGEARSWRHLFRRSR
jgi:hypothetical protein